MPLRPVADASGVEDGLAEEGEAGGGRCCIMVLVMLYL
jgi:hypothetical protein